MHRKVARCKSWEHLLCCSPRGILLLAAPDFDHNMLHSDSQKGFNEKNSTGN